MGWFTCNMCLGMVLSPAFLERLMVWRLKSYTGDKPCSTTSKSINQIAQETGRYPSDIAPGLTRGDRTTQARITAAYALADPPESGRGPAFGGPTL
ncbi:hypothetical protein, partial [Bifidobacterium mongoliense]|uniref:hypothetical protein n=1 Tax=Bifidobacterium mongoliense TaxID=518643 RepID=UPI0030ED0935